MVRAVLLAGGMGTRLHPLTDTLPKPMVPVLGRPWLERLVEHLTSQGIGEVILSLRHGKDIIIRHFDALGWAGARGTGPRVRFLVEPVPLGTGGAIRYAAWPAEDTVVVFNADVVQAFDLGPFLAFHRARGAERPPPAAASRIDTVEEAIRRTEENPSRGRNRGRGHGAPHLDLPDPLSPWRDVAHSSVRRGQQDAPVENRGHGRDASARVMFPQGTSRFQIQAVEVAVPTGDICAPARHRRRSRRFLLQPGAPEFLELAGGQGEGMRDGRGLLPVWASPLPPGLSFHPSNASA